MVHHLAIDEWKRAGKKDNAWKTEHRSALVHLISGCSNKHHGHDETVGLLYLFCCRGQNLSIMERKAGTRCLPIIPLLICKLHTGKPK
jgi:hypothetical protein